MSGKGIFARAFVGYVCLGFLGQNLVFRGTTVSPLWPAAGLALGLLWRRPEHARATTLGIFLGQLVVFWLGPGIQSALAGGPIGWSLRSAPFAMIPACGSALGAAAALALLVRWRARASLDRPIDVLTLAAAGAVQSAIAASFGATALRAMGAVTTPVMPHVAWTWGVGDWIGISLVAPLVLTMSLPAPRARSREPIVLLAATALVAWLAFSGHLLSSSNALNGTYLCLLPLLWGALRVPGPIVAAQTLLVAIFATLPTLRGVGPFAGFAEMNLRMISLQVFLALQCHAALLLASNEAHRRAAEAGRDRKEEELRAARARAEEGSRAKTEFLANMSHEIRTPLNGVLGATQLLATTDLTPDQAELIAVIRGSGEGLLALLDGLLDLSKLEVGRVSLEVLPFEPRALVHSVTELFRARMAPGVSLRVETDPALPERLLGDPVRVRQVLSNLIGNAVKFTSAGAVVVRQRVDAQGRFAVDVEDTGIGIPEDRAHELFQPFVQVDTSTSRRYGGTGLGLAISKKLVEQMGGTIALESKVGVGTTLRLALPLAIAPRAPAAFEAPTPARAHDALARKLRVLVAEDNPVNRKVVGLMLATIDAQVDHAVDGRDAVDRWESGGWDLVVMDCQMPELDGFAATREIRRRERERGLARVPVLALTASAQLHDRERCIDAGMDDVLTKPVRLEDLLSSVARWCARS